MSEIARALTRLFETHRIVFWYDAKRELRAEFDALDLPTVEKLTLNNNQFGLKYRILRQQPDQRFLLYHEGPPPDPLDNWLLDVQLAHAEFRAEKADIWLSEVGLPIEYADIVTEHNDFFHASRRREALRVRYREGDSKRTVRLKLLLICTGAEHDLADILKNLFAELATGKEERFKLVQRCALDTFLWHELERAFGYRSTSPTLHDFLIELFQSCYALGLGEQASLTNDAYVFLNGWKDSTRHGGEFETLSAHCAESLNIQADLDQRPYRTLAQVDLFELIDRKILSDLVRDVANRTISAADCDALIRQRRQSHWIERYRHPYEAVDVAARFLQLLDQLDLTVRSLADGIQQYSGRWYQIDQLYRRLIYHARQSGQITLLSPLLERVENLYTNNYLLPLNDRWQQWVDAAERWAGPPILSQADFFAQCVRPFLQRGNKVFVIISDALRYEVGEELLRRIRQEDRYEAELRPLLSVLPSFTGLGMAALLPHQTLAFAEDASATVLVDGQRSQGTDSRKALLERALPGRATALQAEDFLALVHDASRALFRDYEVVYVYHNRIDAVGDKRDTEERVFEAVEDALEELVKLIKKATTANASNLLVTADHGFLYQHQPLAESDFASQEPAGAQLVTQNRRFVLGRGLQQSSSFKHFTAAAVGLEGETEILLPKSINRLRVKGAGSRYVHGGAALQEVVIPVLAINKKRQSDTTVVEVDILRGSTSVITAGQLTVAFYQAEPVTDKAQPRTLRAGIYNQTKELISDQRELTFDLVAENPRERELRVQFVLTKKADAANGQEVLLRLDERIPDTSHYREYKAVRYTLRRSFTSDFDF
jgi:uncharacterized protein (TIGR02687 family)